MSPVVPPPVVLRLISTWAELEAADASSLFDAAPRREWAEDFFARPGHHLILAVVDGRAVGFVSGVEICHPDKRPEMLLYELGVEEAYRRQGIGRALVDGLRTLAAERDVATTWVVTEPDNVAAGRTYAAAGASDPEPTVVYVWESAPDGSSDLASRRA